MLCQLVGCIVSTINQKSRIALVWLNDKESITVNINWPQKEAEAVVARYPANASVTRVRES